MACACSSRVDGRFGGVDVGGFGDVGPAGGRDGGMVGEKFDVWHFGRWEFCDCLGGLEWRESGGDEVRRGWARDGARDFDGKSTILVIYSVIASELCLDFHLRVQRAMSQGFEGVRI